MGNKQYARALGLSYEYDPEDAVLRFEDGVDYTLDEALHLAKTGPTDVDLQAVHLLKQAFDGELLTQLPKLASGCPWAPVIDDRLRMRLSLLQVGRGAIAARMHRGE